RKKKGKTMFRKIAMLAAVISLAAFATSLDADAYARDGGGPPPHVYKRSKPAKTATPAVTSSVETDRRGGEKPAKRRPAGKTCPAAGSPGLCDDRGGR
ncbi:MAG: hypothetical protein ABJG94_21645, partial [Nitratireductor sp.]